MNLREKGLRPIAELAASRPHGDRLKYLGGCKCMLCRAENSDYNAQRRAARRAGDWNGIVPAWRVRRHIHRLSKRGIGQRAIAEAADIPRSKLIAIMSGAQRNIRKQTESSILRVTSDALLGGTIVSAGPTWRLIKRLLSEGFTKAELARRLGYKSQKLHFNKERIRARNAVKVKRLYNRIMN